MKRALLTLGLALLAIPLFAQDYDIYETVPVPMVEPILTDAGNTIEEFETYITIAKIWGCVALFMSVVWIGLTFRLWGLCDNADKMLKILQQQQAATFQQADDNKKQK